MIGILKNRGFLYSEMQSVEKKNTRKITENCDWLRFEGSQNSKETKTYLHELFGFSIQKLPRDVQPSFTQGMDRLHGTICG